MRTDRPTGIPSPMGEYNPSAVPIVQLQPARAIALLVSLRGSAEEVARTKQENKGIAFLLELAGLYREDDRLRDLMDRYDIVIEDGEQIIFDTALARSNREAQRAYSGGAVRANDG